MADFEVTLEYLEQRTFFGLWQNSNDRTIAKDIKLLSEKYHRSVSIPKGEALPYVVLSRNYNEQSKDFELFIGSITDKNGLENLALPGGEYARITVTPKLGFLWGASIGEAKRYFYTRWIRENPYEALNLEYEYHTEKSKGKHREIDILFAVLRAESKE